ncbi:MAG: hypothetical protein KC590_09545 [Nitrospira sp.]|nr:hypothetical protein [Nitrospira sp.]
MAATIKKSKKKSKKKSTPKNPTVLDSLGLGVKKKKALLSKSPHLEALTVSEFHELQILGAKAAAMGKTKKPGVAGACGTCCCTIN